MNAVPQPSEFAAALNRAVRFSDVKHIPGPPPRFIPAMNTLAVLRDPLGNITHNVATYGRVYRNHAFGGWNVTLAGPEANELILFNRDKIFSSKRGWDPVLDKVFPRGLMLMDFEEHRVHRKTLSVAFKPEPMRHYLGELNSGIARGIAKWPHDEAFKFYPAIKALTLDLAASSFLGIPWGPEADRINRAFVGMVQASVGIVRFPMPGTAMGRGVAGRRYLVKFFGREIPKRRGAAGDDIFTQICNARDEDGRLLSDQEIIDHMNFLMMAAHDTLTSSLTSTLYYLARNPEWQERLRAEVLAVPELTVETLPRLEQVEWAFKEALRLIPPVPSIPRRALKPFVFQNHHIPAGAFVSASPMYTHRDPDVWPDPERFDPSRFSAENSRDRHKYAWVPFGGGPHMCLGLHFAYYQAKSFFWTLLRGYRVEVADGYEADFQMFPIPRPKDGLPVVLRAL